MEPFKIYRLHPLEEIDVLVPSPALGSVHLLLEVLPECVDGILLTGEAGTTHGFDGAPVAYIADQNLNGTIESGDKVWLFTGMRRGGQAYYALDVTNPEAPRRAVPKK